MTAAEKLALRSGLSGVSAGQMLMALAGAVGATGALLVAASSLPSTTAGEHLYSSSSPSTQVYLYGAPQAEASVTGSVLVGRSLAAYGLAESSASVDLRLAKPLGAYPQAITQFTGLSLLRVPLQSASYGLSQVTAAAKIGRILESSSYAQAQAQGSAHVGVPLGSSPQSSAYATSQFVLSIPLSGEAYAYSTFAVDLRRTLDIQATLQSISNFDAQLNTSYTLAADIQVNPAVSGAELAYFVYLDSTAYSSATAVFSLGYVGPYIVRDFTYDIAHTAYITSVDATQYYSQQFSTIRSAEAWHSAKDTSKSHTLTQALRDNVLPVYPPAQHTSYRVEVVATPVATTARHTHVSSEVVATVTIAT